MTDNPVPFNRDEETSSSLLVRVQAQEQLAWERLVHLYTPLVCAWCRHAGLQEADALDVGQEVFQRVSQTIASFRRDRPGDTFRGWLRTIARHKIIDHYRRKAVETAARGGSDALTLMQQQAAPELPEPDAEQDSAEASLICHQAIGLIQREFAQSSWLAFQAVVLKGQKPAEVAAMLHMSVNAVYLAKARILQRLRQEFQDLIDM
jgi:RNA polymerase sigma-70 factor, ECF subfamily